MPLDRSLKLTDQSVVMNGPEDIGELRSGGSALDPALTVGAVASQEAELEAKLPPELHLPSGYREVLAFQLCNAA